MKRHSFPQWVLLAIVTCVLLVLSMRYPDAGFAAINAIAFPVADTGASLLKEAQTAFKKHTYQEALDLLDRAGKAGPLPADALRMKVRAQLYVGKPKEALLDYERLEQVLTHDDAVLLKEVGLGFVVVLIKDMREQMRGAAYTALKDFESAETVPYLEDGLSDGSGLVRALAVEGLGKTGEGRRSVKLRKALDDQAGLVKAAVLKVLGQSQDRTVVPLLEQALKDDQPVVRLAAAGALYHMGRKTMWDQVRTATSAANPEERATALRLLGNLKDDRSLEVLLEAITDPQPSVRGAAASALGDLGKVEGIVAVEQALKDKIPAVRTSAAISLGELGVKTSASVLKQALSDPNPVVRAAVVSALLRIGEPVEEVMSAVDGLLQQSDPGTRSAAAKALGRAQGKSGEAVIGILSDLLADPIPRPRIAAVRSLGQIGGESAIPILKRALHDEDDAVRAAAGGALGRVLNSGAKSMKAPKI
jgi:HEAT repeat protein